MIAFRIIREEFKKQLSSGKLKVNLVVGKGMTLSRIQDFLTSFYSRDASTFQLKNSVLQRQSLWPIATQSSDKSKRGQKRSLEVQKGANSLELQSTPTTPSTESITPSKSAPTSHLNLGHSSQDQVSRHNTRQSATKKPPTLIQPHPSTLNPTPSPINSKPQVQGSSTPSDPIVLGSGQGRQSGSEENQSGQFQELVKLSEGWLSQTKHLDATYKDAQIKLTTTMSDFQSTIARFTDFQRDQVSNNNNVSQNQVQMNSKILESLDAAVTTLKSMGENSAERIVQSMATQFELGRKEMLDSSSKSFEMFKTMMQQVPMGHMHQQSTDGPTPSPLEAASNALPRQMTQTPLPTDSTTGHSTLPQQFSHIPLPPHMSHAPLPPHVGHAPMPPQMGNAHVPSQVNHAPLPSQLSHAPLPHQIGNVPLSAQMGYAPLPLQMEHAPVPSPMVHAPLPPQMGHVPLSAQMGYAPFLPQIWHAPMVSPMVHAPLPPQMGHNPSVPLQMGYPASSQMVHALYQTQTGPHAQLLTPQMGYTGPSNPVMSHVNGGDFCVSVIPCGSFKIFSTRFLILLLVALFFYP